MKSFLNLLNKTPIKSKPEKFKDTIVSLFFLLVTPFILLFSLLFGFFMVIASMFTKSKSKTNKKALDSIKTNSLEWSIFTSFDNLKLYSKYLGELRFGPAYISLKSDPIINEISEDIFGDWFYRIPEGVFLQKWNSKKSPKCDLIFLNLENRNIKICAKSIESFFWEIRKDENLNYVFSYQDSNNKFEYELDIKSVL